jgi:hypothetical protein
MKRYTTFCVLILLAFLCQNSFAQIHAGAFLGFKSYSLNATVVLTNSQGKQIVPAADAGGTVFNVGGTAGYTALSMGMYKLDLDAALSFSSIGFFQRGFEKSNGNGSFAANGLSGGTTSAFELDLLGINKLSLPALKVVEPYAGLGVSMNLYSTSTLVQNNASAQGASAFKLGLCIVYGAEFPILPFMTPYIRFSHLIPFGSELKLTDDSNGTFTVQDVPGYFGLTAGVMLSI